MTQCLRLVCKACFQNSWNTEQNIGILRSRHRLSKNTSRGCTRCLLPAYSLVLGAGCLHKKGNWVTVNERAAGAAGRLAWVTVQGPGTLTELALGGGLKPSSVPRPGKLQDHKQFLFYFFGWVLCLPKCSPKDQSPLASLINWKK